MLENAQQAERLASERAAAQERFERYRTAVTVSDDLAGLRANHPSPNPLPVLEQVVGRLRTLDTRTRELKAALAGEIEVSFEIPPPPTWRPISRIGLLLVALGLLVAGGAFPGNPLTTIRLGPAPPAP